MRIIPPCTLPKIFEWDGPIKVLIVTTEAETGFFNLSGLLIFLNFEKIIVIIMLSPQLSKYKISLIILNRFFEMLIFIIL